MSLKCEARLSMDALRAYPMGLHASLRLCRVSSMPDYTKNIMMPESSASARVSVNT